MRVYPKGRDVSDAGTDWLGSSLSHRAERGQVYCSPNFHGQLTPQDLWEWSHCIENCSGTQCCLCALVPPLGTVDAEIKAPSV